MKLLLQTEIEAISNWCQEHLTVDYKDKDGWAVMCFGGQRIIRCRSENGVPQDYLICHTPIAQKVIGLYNTWKDYE